MYINVLDENDNPPRVSQAVYEANVDEDANVGACVACRGWSTVGSGGNVFPSLR